MSWHVAIQISILFILPCLCSSLLHSATAESNISLFLLVIHSCAPNNTKPSTVSVPVLSNSSRLINPATLMRLGDMQYMSSFLNLCRANPIPTLIADSNAGGTVIVTKSKPRKHIIYHDSPIITKL
eukprot:NODE_248_length_12985_cov_0.286357.p8 type:complete len:126 gc:universal NODE_248_length_12985_cov_0.286357:2089-1712(-)